MRNIQDLIKTINVLNVGRGQQFCDCDEVRLEVWTRVEEEENPPAVFFGAHIINSTADEDGNQITAQLTIDGKKAMLQTDSDYESIEDALKTLNTYCGLMLRKLSEHGLI